MRTWVEREFVIIEGGGEVLGSFTLNNLNLLMAESLVAAELTATCVKEGKVWVRARPGGGGGNTPEGA